MAYSTTGLPVIPYTLTTTLDGIKYETHVLTNTCQVITEDGIALCDVLKELVTHSDLEALIPQVNSGKPSYHYMGILMNKPDISAIDQLYEKVGMQDCEVYLVQRSVDTSLNNDTNSQRNINAYDMYCWADAIHSWVFSGSTEKNMGSLELSESLNAFPEKLGLPGQTIMVSTNGKTLEWKFPDKSAEVQLESHNNDAMAHPMLLEQLSSKASKLKIFNTVLEKCQWSWMSGAGYYSYILSDERFKPHSYFEITPIAFTKSEMNILRNAGIHPIYKIEDSEQGSYAILHADHVPVRDIEVCVKLYGDYDDS